MTTHTTTEGGEVYPEWVFMLLSGVLICELGSEASGADPNPPPLDKLVSSTTKESLKAYKAFLRLFAASVC